MKPAHLAVVAAVTGAALLSVLVMCPASPLSHGLSTLWRMVVGSPAVAPVVKPDGAPHIHITGGGSAVWVPSTPIAPGDSIPVSVWVDIGPGLDTATVVIGQDTIPVAIDIEIDGPIYPFRVWGEAAFDGPSVFYGGGASWEPLRLWGASGGPGLCAGDGWFAPVARISRPIYSTLQAGAEAGWRFQRGPDELHFGVSFGFQI